MSTELRNNKSFWQSCKDNAKWFFCEILKIYSGKDSFFSKKRIESGIAFIVAQWGMIFFLLEKHSSLSMGEFLLWASVEFAVAGYIVNKIEKSKTNSNHNQSSNTETQN